MRLKWWQHGLHLEPESQEDYDKLKVIHEMLERLSQCPTGAPPAANTSA